MSHHLACPGEGCHERVATVSGGDVALARPGGIAQPDLDVGEEAGSVGHLGGDDLQNVLRIKADTV